MAFARSVAALAAVAPEMKIYEARELPRDFLQNGKAVLEGQQSEDVQRVGVELLVAQQLLEDANALRRGDSGGGEHLGQLRLSGKKRRHSLEL